MIRINWVHYRHEDLVILLDSEVVNFTIKVVIKGRRLGTGRLGTRRLGTVTLYISFVD
jgi:hypothetical protein